jgi:hypothetical protein
VVQEVRKKKKKKKGRRKKTDCFNGLCRVPDERVRVCERFWAVPTWLALVC